VITLLLFLNSVSHQTRGSFIFIYLTDCEFEIVLSSVGKEIIQKRLFLKIKFYCLGIKKDKEREWILL